MTQHAYSRGYGASSPEVLEWIQKQGLNPNLIREDGVFWDDESGFLEFDQFIVTDNGTKMLVDGDRRATTHKQVTTPRPPWV